MSEERRAGGILRRCFLFEREHADFHLAAILGGWTRGLGFAGALAVLYAALYGILRSEQNALLLGSLLLFLALAGLMLGTRKIDWYHLGKYDAAAGA